MRNRFEHSQSFLGRRAAVLLWLACGLLALVFWPTDVLEVRPFPPGESPGAPLISVPAPLGFEYRTRILHSVQLTPVEDVYRVQEGNIHAWQERIMSHNAGLPSLPPERGRFYSDPPWMIVEGTGEFWPYIVYRVGTDELGKNELFLPKSGWRDLWRQWPGERLLFSVDRKPLLWAWREWAE